MDSPFGDWFDAQFPPESGMLASRTDEQLTDMIRLGNAAEAELATRRIRRDQERAALMAWQAAEKLHPACMGGTTLTDEERAAFERAADLIDAKTCGDSATLRSLLERL